MLQSNALPTELSRVLLPFEHTTHSRRVTATLFCNNMGLVHGFLFSILQKPDFSKCPQKFQTKNQNLADDHHLLDNFLGNSLLSVFYSVVISLDYDRHLVSQWLFRSLFYHI